MVEIKGGKKVLVEKKIEENLKMKDEDIEKEIKKKKKWIILKQK